MKRRWTNAALAMAVFCGVYLLAGATAQETGRRATNQGAAKPQAVKPASAKAPPPQAVLAAPASAPAFDGKLVAVYVRGAQQAKLLEQTGFMEVKGRTFLVGKEVPATMSFSLGTDAHVAWDSVDAFYVFDNAEQYEAALQKALQGVGSTMETVLEGVFSGGQEGKDAGAVPVPEPQDEASYGAPHFAPEDGDAVPTTPHRVSEGSKLRYIKRTVRGRDGSEIVVYEQRSDSPQMRPYLAAEQLPKSHVPILVTEDNTALSANPPDASKPVVRSNPPMPMPTLAPLEGRSKPAQSAPATALPPPAPR
ncbi:MAG TPA: hypothetical protein VHB99_07820 [Pirellulales bacterium]|nr:hypothetical protein [Pirellulales bacterium]